MSSEILDIQKIKDEVSQLLGRDVHPNDLTFRAGVILCSCMLVGTDLDAIADFTGYSKARGILQKCLRNINESGIAKPDGTLDLRWDADTEDKKAVQIVLDFLAVAGQVKRESDSSGSLFYLNNDK